MLTRIFTYGRKHNSIFENCVAQGFMVYTGQRLTTFMTFKM